MIETKIEIKATPEQVRKVFLDFEHWSEIGSDLMRSITRLPSHLEGDIEKGEKLAVNFKGMTSQVTVLENSGKEFKWRGDTLYVISGEHSFRFEESSLNGKGWTTFHNDELPLRLNILLMKIIPGGKKLFEDFCTGFKERVERVIVETAEATV